MIDMAQESLRLLTRASADVPGRPHPSTLIRWAMRGIRGVRLETVMIGGRRYTSVQAIQRFVEALTSPQSPRTPTASSNEHLERYLDTEGL